MVQLSIGMTASYIPQVTLLLLLLLNELIIVPLSPKTARTLNKKKK